MNRRLPKRSEKMPASGATTIVAPVQTSSFSPAWKGVLPSTFCMYCERKKIEPNMPKYMVSEATLVTAKERLAKKDIGSIGSAVRSSTTTKAISSSDVRRRARRARGAGPAERLRAHEAEDDAEQAAGTERKAAQVERAVWAAALGQPARGQRSEREADGHVDPEDPVPGDALHDGAADERAERDGDAGDARPDADGDAAALLGKGFGEQRERERRDDRGAGALHRARGDQQVGAARQRGGGGGGREHAEAEQEHALAPEAVAERGAGEQQHGVGEHVCVDGPLQRLDRGAELAMDRRQRDADDEVVEHDHEQRHRDDAQRPTVPTRYAAHLMLLSRFTKSILAVANNILYIWPSAARIASTGHAAGWYRAWLGEHAQARSARARGEYSGDDAKDEPDTRSRWRCARARRRCWRRAARHEDGDEGQRTAADAVDAAQRRRSRPRRRRRARRRRRRRPRARARRRASTTTRAAPEPAFTQNESKTEGLSAASATVRAKGFTPNDTSDYHSDQALRVLVGTRTGSGDGYGQQAFFFVNGRYIGTDTKDTSATVKVRLTERHRSDARLSAVSQQRPAEQPKRRRSARDVRAEQRQAHAAGQDPAGVVLLRPQPPVERPLALAAQPLAAD